MEGKDSGRISNQYLIVERVKLVRGPLFPFPFPMPRGKKDFKMQLCGVASASDSSGKIVCGLPVLNTSYLNT